MRTLHHIGSSSFLHKNPEPNNNSSGLPTRNGTLVWNERAAQLMQTLLCPCPQP